MPRSPRPKAAAKPKPRRAWPDLGKPQTAAEVFGRPSDAPSLEMPVLRNREEILDCIDSATEPRVMDKPAALKWLELMVCDLECRMDALKEEIANES